MSKCETCVYYEYKAGVDPRLAKQIGLQNHPTVPTCICRYANRAWMRWTSEVRKPTGMACEYVRKTMTCTECGGHNTRGMLVTNSRDGKMICAKCRTRLLGGSKE